MKNLVRIPIKRHKYEISDHNIMAPIQKSQAKERNIPCIFAYPHIFCSTGLTLLFIEKITKKMYAHTFMPLYELVFRVPLHFSIVCTTKWYRVRCSAIVFLENL